MGKDSVRPIKRSSILFLQTLIVLIGIAVLALMLIEPHLEGRNKQASIFQTYFNDPFLIYAYAASVPFFVILFKAFNLLGYIGHNKVFSQAAVHTLKTIKYCAFIVAGAIVAAIVYLKLASLSNNEDPAGAIMLGSVAAFASIVIGAAAAAFEKTLQSAVIIKSENDLTV